MSDEVAVLLLEDDPHDAFLMQRAFELAGLGTPLITVQDGEEAIDYLRGHGIYADRARYPLPCLILTDLKMPRMTGFHFLEWLHQQPDLKAIPAVAISGSCIESDMERAVRLGARKYFVKPTHFEELIQIARELKQDWIGVYCPA